MPANLPVPATRATLSWPTCSALLLALCLLVMAGPGAPHSAAVSPPGPATGPRLLIATVVTQRELAATETWTSATPRFQDVVAKESHHTVTLGDIGADGPPVGAVLVARVQAQHGQRILFRRADGSLLTFWRGDDAHASQWVTLRATENGWEPSLSGGRETSGPEALSWKGAETAGAIQPDLDGGAQPEARHGGFRFETDAQVFFVRCRGDAARFRVIANGELLAEVKAANGSGKRMLVPIELGTAVRRRIEILADELEFDAILVPDVRHSVSSWIVVAAAQPSAGRSN